MIRETCQACGQTYAFHKGHQCPQGAHKPKPPPWKERKKEYDRNYMRPYMQNKRAEEKAAHKKASNAAVSRAAKTRAEQWSMKAEELRTIAEGMQSDDCRARMIRLADTYDVLVDGSVFANAGRKGGAA